MGIAAFLKWMRHGAGRKGRRPKDDLQPDPQKPVARLMGGACDKTQDLIVCHDGERIGFRKPIE